MKKKKTTHFTKQMRRASMTIEEKTARRKELRMRNGHIETREFTPLNLPFLKELIAKGAL